MRYQSNALSTSECQDINTQDLFQELRILSIPKRKLQQFKPLHFLQSTRQTFHCRGIVLIFPLIILCFSKLKQSKNYFHTSVSQIDSVGLLFYPLKGCCNQMNAECILTAAESNTHPANIDRTVTLLPWPKVVLVENRNSHKTEIMKMKSNCFLTDMCTYLEYRYAHVSVNSSF